MWEYLIVLIAMLLCSVFLGNGRILFVLFALFANWIINTIIVAYLAITDPWAIFLPIDYMTALILLLVCDKPCRWIASIAIIYALQCIGHGAYGAIAASPYARYYYYYFLSYSAWVQLIIIGGWGVVEFYSPIRRDFGWLSFTRTSFAHDQAGKESSDEA